MDSMLSLYRRHTKKCPHRSKGVRWARCNCPVHAWGALPNGKWIRKAVGTRSMSQARRTVEQWERDQRTDAPPPIGEATDAFLLSHKDSARAMVLLMRYTGLSIRNTFLLRRDQIHDGRLVVRRAKNGKPICVPVMLDLQAALEAVPVPRTAQDPSCPYFFYNGRDDIPIEYAQRSAEGTMKAVFKRSGITNAKTHRFRHTLATRMLEQGASYEDVSVVLGNSARIVEKHYAKWSKGRQERIDRYFRAAHGMSEESEVVQ